MSAARDPYRDTENLRWELLGNCVFEDAQMLFEFRDAVRAHFPELDASACAQLTTQLVRDLLASDLVYLHRRDLDGSERVLTRSDIDAVFASHAWTRAPGSGELVEVWIAATAAGEAAANDPPDHIRELWQWPPPPWRPAES